MISQLFFQLVSRNAGKNVARRKVLVLKFVVKITSIFQLVSRNAGKNVARRKVLVLDFATIFSAGFKKCWEECGKKEGSCP